MMASSLILILAAALCFFYLQVLCQSILRREFDQPYFRSILTASRLEFPAVRKAMEGSEAQVDYSRLRTMLNCDFLALLLMLKHAAKVKRGPSLEERLLIIYFRLCFFSMSIRHRLRLQEKSAILKLTAILQHFANLVGQRVQTVNFCDPLPDGLPQ